jgi:hypothetical protein
VIGTPAFAGPPVEIDEALDEVRLADAVGPGRIERHEFGRVDALLSEVSELDDLVLGRQPQLEPRGAQPQPEEGAGV